jgi:hypothetical protein
MLSSYLELVEAAGVEPQVGSVESVTYRKREALIPPITPETPVRYKTGTRV